MALKHFFTLLIILSYAGSLVIDIDSATSFKIPKDTDITAKMSSRPSAGLIWAMIPEDSSTIEVENPYGQFSLDEENRNQGFQKFNFSCKDCEPNQVYFAYFVLKRPWKENYSEIRKVSFTLI